MKKYLLIFLTAVVVYIVAAVLVYYWNPFTNINEGCIALDDSTTLIRDPKNHFIFDTGAEGTIFFNFNKINSKIPIGAAIIFDTYRKVNLIPSFFCRKIKLTDSVSISNVIFSYPINDIDSVIRSSENGIIGMNVLSKANWHCSFRKYQLQTLHFDKENSVPANAIAIDYHGSLRPQTTLNLNNTTIKDVLIDTGCDEDLVLDSISISKLSDANISSRQEGQSSGLWSRTKVVQLMYSTLDINGIAYNDVGVRQGSSNILGCRFLRRFDNMFWDSEKQRVYLWNDSIAQ